MRRPSRLPGKLLTVLAGVFVLQECGGTPSRPTQIFVAPALVCPAPVSVVALSGLPPSVVYVLPVATGGTPPTVVSCSPPSGSTFPIGSTPVTCTATDQVKRTASCTFTVTATKPAPPPPPRLTVTRFLAFGDSITWGEDGDASGPAYSPQCAGTVVMSLGVSATLRPRVQLPLPQTYPGALQARLANLYTAQSPLVKNAGCPGEAVTSAETFPRFVSLTSSGDYDVVLLMEGANDLSNPNVASVMAGLGRMIDDAKNRRLQVLLATITPENPAGGEKARFWMSVAPFNDQVRTLAHTKGVPLVDVYQAFGGDLSLLGPDGLHPNAQGYARIADTLLNSIRQTFELPAVASSTPARALPWFVPPRRR